MRVLILGGNSDVALALARGFAREYKADIILASRDMELLEKRAKDISVRAGVEARAVRFDATDHASHKAFYDSIEPKPDIVIAAFGYLGDQKKAESDPAEAMLIIGTNYTGAVSVLEIVAADMEARKVGTIIGIGSVAGERGRKSNYVYGSAKGALKIYLSGLRNRLSSSDVRVITVLPGFMATKMTEGMNLPAALTASPEDAAADIISGYANGKAVVYTKWFWRWIMLIIRLIPEKKFMKMDL